MLGCLSAGLLDSITLFSLLLLVCIVLYIYCDHFSATGLELNIQELLVNVSDWKKLGQLLNVSHGQIQQLSQCAENIEYYREEVVSLWLKEDTAASWEKLYWALEQMGHETEIQTIRKKFMRTHFQHSESCTNEGTSVIILLL